jgi:2-hydroxy-3-keto-5-methylthiopentenyl-1-phosphate phosphatase
MQKQIANLDRQEAEAIADIVSSKQIVALNDRMANLATELHDENIQAVERVRQKAKAKAKLSEELAGTNHADIEKQIVAAGMNSEINEEFARMLAETELKAKERPGAQRAEADRMM